MQHYGSVDNCSISGMGIIVGRDNNKAAQLALMTKHAILISVIYNGFSADLIRVTITAGESILVFTCS